MKTQNPLSRDEKLVIYTAITGGYDQLRQPSKVLEWCDYVCFSDQPITNPGIWQLRQPPPLKLDNVRLNRFLKLMPHRVLSEYQSSIYIDGNIEIIGDISPLLENGLREHSIAVFTHPFRNCIYEEARRCIIDDIDSPLRVFKQVRRYALSGYPHNQGLVEANVLIRQHHDLAVIELMENWWQEILGNSRRDQLSFNYLCWKQGITYQSLGISDIRTDNSIFLLHPHLATQGTLVKTWRRRLFRPLRKLFLNLFPFGN